ncbi:uncharacterized protein DUF2510 [Nocardioides sp. J9]|uniref:DUF2510 domain-containing protein n=1 Tax=Nocardioides sp. J9 TaxID=935844 RepID=UPI0011A71914|nr:DUF2510 domain-containing protein [Nocardioides sp. J9]TWH00807.1 uncharacterized protein DUF2510 [Nocardioides sp. J9]
MTGPTPSQPGWYDDGDGRERWFDGNAWTDHVRGEVRPSPEAQDGQDAPNGQTVVVPAPQDAPGPVPPATQQLQVGGGKGLRVTIGLLGALVLVAVAVVAVLLVLGRDGDDAEPAVDDTSTPVEPEPTPEDAPSSLDLPTIDPSDFPSDLPTIDPTDFPSELPTGLPTDFPSDFLSDFPTDPEDFASWASELLEP